MRTALALATFAACSTGQAAAIDRAAAPPPPPADCRAVEAGDDLAVTIAAAHDGDALCLAPGEHLGPVRIDRRVTVWGPADAVVRAARPATAITVAAAGVRLAGFTIDGTGGVFDREDSAVDIVADDVTVEGLTVIHPVYGIEASQVKGITVRGNHIEGDAATSLGLRGDTIRFWQVDDSTIADNLVEDGRDVVVWYSNRIRVTGNRMLRGRYGTHFMYSTDDVVEDNRYQDGVVGVFAMYSHRITMRRNVVVDAGGASGMAIGLKDSGDITVASNLLIRDALGIYVDDSPSTVGESLVVDGNAIRQCEVAVALHTTPHATTIADNDLADDREPVRAEAGVDPDGASWRGNYYDDYTGYDLDGDGAGDLPYQAHEASEAMIAQHPDLAFFRGSPVMAMVDAASSLMPLFAPRVLLTDPAPRMAPHDPEEILDAR